ncbi:MAG TPA: cob(I)yrinic acid a,c-diamide adenosyltransferase [Trueperaceae bacterium]|nr:cob(I)yrinic acid a,c-diamide adenosyltransferase [Trueperaceae bacterium]
MKIYTRTGDSGETGLFGGGRVPKDDLRVRAYGAVDEANAALGLARAALAGPGASVSAAALAGELETLQSLLFDLGADLATPLDAKARHAVRGIADADVAALEARIDALDAELEPLTSFVLPGGSAAAAALHVARSVARRAERETVALARAADINPEALRCLNRLSDLLFTLARAVNARSGVPDVPWRGAARER